MEVSHLSNIAGLEISALPVPQIFRAINLGGRGPVIMGFKGITGNSKGYSKDPSRLLSINRVNESQLQIIIIIIIFTCCCMTELVDSSVY